MRKRAFFIFFSIVLTVYGLINFYIFIRGWVAFPQDSSLRILFLVVFLIFSLSFIAGRFLERVALSWFTNALVWIGSFWLGAMVYFFLIIVAIDLLRLINFTIRFFPSFVTADYERTKYVTALAVIGLVALLVIAGYINALKPRIKTLRLTIPKDVNPTKALNIVAASDIHLGTVICKARLERIVEKINELKPDLVLLPGDVVDEDLGPVIKQNLGETLRKIESRFGVVAITGNHEYIGGVDEACRYLVEHGITVLRDSSLRIDDCFYIVGREDLSINRFAGKKRKSLEELMASVDRRYPIIMMDHQPFHLEEAGNGGVDVQLSGHTHHGQLWPFNFITKKVYELSWGYKKKGNTHIYVSSGVGTWGPPMRTGNRPEIVNIQLSFG
ncbi:MAG: metallophosphoesterase [Bacteroidota bacterium]